MFCVISAVLQLPTFVSGMPLLLETEAIQTVSSELQISALLAWTITLSGCLNSPFLRPRLQL